MFGKEDNMDSIKKFIKNHKIITTFIVLFLILIIGIIIAYNIMFRYKEDSRLNGKKEVEISSSSQNSIKENLEKKDEFNSVAINIVTKQITFTIDVKEDTDKKFAKNLSEDVLNELSDEEKKYYDVQVIYTCKECKEDDKTYPIIGYKNKNNNDIVWSNN